MRGRLILILADIIIPGIVTLIGFASHSTAGSADASLLSTFLLLLASWFLVAPFLGVYNPGASQRYQTNWCSFWSLALAEPFASWMRGARLNVFILPLFVVILGGTGALAILA